MSTKVVFFDFDGVLNSWDYFTASSDHESTEAGALDPRSVQRLNRLIASTGAVVVVSSSWRCGRTVERLQAILDERGFAGRVVDKTIDLTENEGGIWRAKQRGDEIRDWLDAHPEVTAYVVLDDDSDMDAVREQHVKTSSFSGGLLDAHVDRAIAMLGVLT